MTTMGYQNGLVASTNGTTKRTQTPPQKAAPQKRRARSNYDDQTKQQIADEFFAAEGQGRIAVANRYKVSANTVYGWVNAKKVNRLIQEGPGPIGRTGPALKKAGRPKMASKKTASIGAQRTQAREADLEASILRRLDEIDAVASALRAALAVSRRKV